MRLGALLIGRRPASLSELRRTRALLQNRAAQKGLHFLKVV
jgi:hypothetical protein